MHMRETMAERVKVEQGKLYTSLHCGLSLLGADDIRFYHHLSSAKAMQLCFVTNIPLGLDDQDD